MFQMLGVKTFSFEVVIHVTLFINKRSASAEIYATVATQS